MSDTTETPTTGAPYGSPGPRNGHERRALLPEEKTIVQTVASGASIETLAGAGAAILAIIGLTGTRMFEMASIATLVIGGALVALGGAIAMRAGAIHRRADEEPVGSTAIERAHQSELLAGAAGIVLGVLALLGIDGRILVPVAVIVFGAALLRAGTAAPDVVHLARPGTLRAVGGGLVRTSADTLVVAGVGAIVLGILAFARIAPWLTLSLIGLLVTGAALFLSGGAVAGVFYRRLRIART